MIGIAYILLLILTLMGLPLFLVIGGSALLGYLKSGQSLALFFASNLETVASNPLFLAIPLFTLAGYLMAESNTPKRLVNLSEGLFGWMPGGLAIVSLLAMAFFTAFTGASGVTIIALGGLLFPALIKEGYPEPFTLGLLTTGGSRGLTFPPSLPLIIFAMIAGLSMQGADIKVVHKTPAAVTQTASTAQATRATKRPRAKKQPGQQDIDRELNAALDNLDKGTKKAAPKKAGVKAGEDIDQELNAALDNLDKGTKKAAPKKAKIASKTRQPKAAAAPMAPDSGPGSPWSYTPTISVDRLFVAGALPGLFSLFLIIFYAMWVGAKKGVKRTKFDPKRAWRSIRDAAWEIPIPFIIIVGIYGGFFTAVDAAAITAAYVFVVEVLIYRDLPASKLFNVMTESMLLVGSIMLILLAALSLTNYFIDAQVPQQIFAMIKQHVHSRLTFLIFLNLFLLIVGCLMDIFSAILVVVPIIMPVALYYHVDPTHLGVIFLINLDIGYSTPPVGINLFIGALRFKRPVLTLYKATLPYLAIMLFALIVITYWPDMSLWLVNYLGVQ